MKYILLFFFSYQSLAFTLNNNISAGFTQNVVHISVTSNSVCENAGITKEELIQFLSPAVDRFWNTVPTSRLELVVEGEFETEDANFLTGALCNPDLESTCGSSYAPQVTEIVVACSTNEEMFPSQSILARTLPNNINDDGINGSVILINNTIDSSFADQSDEIVVSILAHEIGHAIGLGHSGSKASLMYYAVVPTRNSLGQDDVDGLTYLYPTEVDGCGFLTTKNSNDFNSKTNSFWFLSMLLGFLLPVLLKRPKVNSASSSST